MAKFNDKLKGSPLKDRELEKSKKFLVFPWEVLSTKENLIPLLVCTRIQGFAYIQNILASFCNIFTKFCQENMLKSQKKNFDLQTVFEASVC